MAEATAEGGAATVGGRSIGGRALNSGDALKSFSVAFGATITGTVLLECCIEAGVGLFQWCTGDLGPRLTVSTWAKLMCSGETTTVVADVGKSFECIGQGYHRSAVRVEGK